MCVCGFLIWEWHLTRKGINIYKDKTWDRLISKWKSFYLQIRSLVKRGPVLCKEVVMFRHKIHERGVTVSVGFTRSNYHVSIVISKRSLTPWRRLITVNRPSCREQVNILGFMEVDGYSLWAVSIGYPPETILNSNLTKKLSRLFHFDCIKIVTHGIWNILT